MASNRANSRTIAPPLAPLPAPPTYLEIHHRRQMPERIARRRKHLQPLIRIKEPQAAPPFRLPAATAAVNQPNRTRAALGDRDPVGTWEFKQGSQGSEDTDFKFVNPRR